MNRAVLRDRLGCGQSREFVKSGSCEYGYTIDSQCLSSLHVPPNKKRLIQGRSLPGTASYHRSHVVRSAITRRPDGTQACFRQTPKDTSRLQKDKATPPLPPSPQPMSMFPRTPVPPHARGSYSRSLTRHRSETSPPKRTKIARLQLYPVGGSAGSPRPGGTGRGRARPALTPG